MEDCSNQSRESVQGIDQSSSMDNTRSRLLRSQLKRQRLLIRLESEKKQSKRERREREREEIVTLPIIERHSFHLPHISIEPPVMLQSPLRNTKSDLVDVMMMQSSQVNQLVSQRMMLSMLTPPPPPPSPPPSSPQTNRRSIQREKLTFELLVDLIEKSKSNRMDEHRMSQMPHHHHYYYLPVIQRSDPQFSTLERKPKVSDVVEDRMTPVSMTSRWRQRTPEKKERPSQAFTQPRSISDHRHRLRNNKALKKRFRHAAYAAVFTRILINRQPKRLLQVLRHPIILDDVITGIRIKECVQSLHRKYLNPEGKLLRILTLTFDPDLDVSSVLSDKSTKEQRHKTMETLASFIEHVTFEMTFAPASSGSLGTVKNSNLYHLLRPQQTFPDNYFWDMEKEPLSVDSFSRTPAKMTSREELLVLVGLCLGRGLVSTVLLYPFQYGLTQSAKTEILSTKIRLMITLMVYLLRRIYAHPGDNPVPVALPDNLSRKLYSDEAMANIFKKLNSSFEYAEKLLREWGENYSRKFRNS